MSDLITHIIPRLQKVNRLMVACTGGTMPFEQAYAVARLYYDFQDTNRLIAEAERMAGEDAGLLKKLAVTLKYETATLINNMGRLDGVDFKVVAGDHSGRTYSIFRKASEELTPYWKRYCGLNKRLDYLPLGSTEYAEAEKKCAEAKAEHDARQAEVKKLYAVYEEESRRTGDVFFFKSSHLYALATRLNSIAGSIIVDLDRMEKGDSQ